MTYIFLVGLFRFWACFRARCSKTQVLGQCWLPFCDLGGGIIIRRTRVCFNPAFFESEISSAPTSWAGGGTKENPPRWLIPLSVGLSSAGPVLFSTRPMTLNLVYFRVLPLKQKAKQMFREHDNILLELAVFLIPFHWIFETVLHKL